MFCLKQTLKSWLIFFWSKFFLCSLSDGKNLFDFVALHIDEVSGVAGYAFWFRNIQQGKGYLGYQVQSSTLITVPLHPLFWLYQIYLIPFGFLISLFLLKWCSKINVFPKILTYFNVYMYSYSIVWILNEYIYIFIQSNLNLFCDSVSLQLLSVCWCLPVSGIHRGLHCLCFVSAAPHQTPLALLGYLCMIMGHHEDIPWLKQIQTNQSTSCSSRQVSLLLHLNVQLCLGGFIGGCSTKYTSLLSCRPKLGPCKPSRVSLVLSLVGCVDTAGCICTQMSSNHICSKILLQQW